MSYQKEREEFASLCAKEGIPYRVALVVMRHANTIQRLAARACSVEMSEKQAAREEKQSDNCERLISDALKPYGTTADFQGDPRGCCVKLHVPSGYSNAFAGGGMCVPTREY